MGITMHLVRRELRDARAILVGIASATAALAFVATWLVGRFLGKGWTPEVTTWFVPLVTALGAALAGAAVAAESFAGDTTSRRIDGAALLPVALGRVFAAKAAATALAWALAAFWTAAGGMLAVTVFGGDASVVNAGWVVQAVLGVLPVVAGVALLACVLEHGLGAVLGAVVLVGGGGFSVLRFTPWEEWGLRPVESDVLAATVPVTLVLGAAAWLAFVKGPIHLGRRVRRAALGLVPSLGVLVVGGAAAAAALDARVDVAPGDPDAQIASMRVSPDGAHAVLFVGNRRAPTTSQAWSVRIADGRTVPIPGRYWSFHAFGETGRVALWSGTRENRNAYATIRTVDLDTGAIVATRSAEQAAATWTDRWARVRQSIDGVLVEWPERGVQRRFERAWSVAVSPRPGRICVWRNGGRADVVDLDTDAVRAVPTGSLRGLDRWSADGRFLRLAVGRGVKTQRMELDCETGAVREIVPPSGAWGTFGDGPYATFHPDKDTTAVADVRDGRIVAGPWTKRGVALVAGSDRLAVAYNGPEPTMLLDLATGRATAIEPNPNSYGYPPNVLHALPGGGLLVVRPGNGLDVADTEGRTLRTLLPGWR